MGVPPPQLPPQLETIPRCILQFHVQEVNPVLFIFRCGQQLLPIGGAANNLHIIVFNKDLPLQGGLDLMADSALIVTNVNPDHGLPSTVSSCTNTPPSQLVQVEALG